MPSIEQLQELLKAEPNDSFLRYALAMELSKQRRFTEAVAEFEALLKIDPNYVAGYFMMGRTLGQMGGTEDRARAAATLKQGIEVAKRAGNHHAAGEMQDELRVWEE